MCLLGVSTFQPHYNPSQPQKCDFCRIFWFRSFLEFVPRITSLRIEVGSWNLLCILNKSLRCAFWVFQLFGVKIQLCPNLGEGVLRGQKRKNCPFFPANWLKIWSYVTYPKINPISQLGGEIRSFPPLLTSKKCGSSPNCPPNWARKLKLRMYIR